MKQLAPKLFERRFSDLMEIGRASIPALAPAWTDHNAHDPGITLMELLAWVAEAQLYSHSRIRRDERTAYASLLGISESGTTSATGILWSDPNDPESPSNTYQRTMVIADNAAIRFLGADSPPYTPTNRLLWIAGRIEKLESRGPGRESADLTAINERGGIAYLPFGETAGSRDILSMLFDCRDRAGMFGLERTKGALWPIGVRVERPDDASQREAVSASGSSLAAYISAGGERVKLDIVSDTTGGFLRTGVILLNPDAVEVSHAKFTIEFHSPGAFARPPRVVKIEPNVIPIQQRLTIGDEVHTANGLPDLTFTIDKSGLKFNAGEQPVNIEVLENGGWRAWSRSGDLTAHGPVESVYEFDAARGEVAFGNGINGRVPPAEAQIRVGYEVSNGEGGNVGRQRKWLVGGFSGVFGTNPEPINGGAGAPDFRRQRSLARGGLRVDHALVTAEDIADAARGLDAIEVERAWIADAREDLPRTGSVTLVAMRKRHNHVEPHEPPETRRWLAEIHRALVARIPLGTRLTVLGPRYCDFSIRARVETEKGVDPSNVEKRILAKLGKRLALTVRQPGVSVNKHDVIAWMRSVDGVRRIAKIDLINAKSGSSGSITVAAGALPRWTPSTSKIEAKGAESGGNA